MSNLKTIFSYGFPTNHLFTVSLVRTDEPDYPMYKNRHFVFLNFWPEFNKDNAINMKAELQKVLALGKHVRALSSGRTVEQVGEFKILADSSRSNYGQQGQQNLRSCWASTFGGQQGGPKKVSISASQQGSKPFGWQGTLAEAAAVADIIEFIAMKGLELEFKMKSMDGRVGAVQSTTPLPPPPVQPPVMTPENVVNDSAHAMGQQSAPTGMPDDDDIPF